MVKVMGREREGRRGRIGGGYVMESEGECVDKRL